MEQTFISSVGGIRPSLTAAVNATIARGTPLVTVGAVQIRDPEAELHCERQIAVCSAVSAAGRKTPPGEIKTEQTFREASEQYLPEYDIITQGNATRDRWTASTGGPGCI